MRTTILLFAVLSAGCAHGVRGPDQRDPDVLELQATVLSYVLHDSRDYLDVTPHTSESGDTVHFAISEDDNGVYITPEDADALGTVLLAFAKSQGYVRA